MENYVRRCMMFAVIWLIIGVFLCLFGIAHNRNEMAVASKGTITVQAATIVENVDLTVRVRPVENNNTKLPDEGRPKHANAVEPPTEVHFIEEVTETVAESPKYAAASVAAVAVVEAPKYDAAPVATAAVVETIFRGANRYASITLTPEQNELLARLIYHESRGIGGAAVAETVFNRMLSGEFPSTIEDVIYMENAFSPSGILWTAEIKEPEAMERCREIPAEVLNGESYLLPSTDYCYFHAGHATLDGDYEYGGNVFYADYAAHH